MLGFYGLEAKEVAETIGVLRETRAGERRVALVPGHVAALRKAEHDVVIEPGAGRPAGFEDAAYTEAGATLTERDRLLAQADRVLTVNGGSLAADGAGDAAAMKPEATLIGLLNPFEATDATTRLAERGVSAYALELVPRITRAQSMDVLSSQANLAGYRAVILSAAPLGKIFPMLMTAAGTVVPARVFIVGVGVAGLQAIATAKRLGAVVSAYDIRPAVKEQVESLGAKFLELELDQGDAESGGGYARQMDEAFYAKQRQMMLQVLAESDIVITTAAIPGRKAPTLVTAEMVAAMQPGSVIMDLAAERGGNCELTQPGATVEHGGVTIVGPENVAAGVAFHASQLFSKNIVNFVQLLDATKSIGDDEILAGSAMLYRGACPDQERAATLGVAYRALPTTTATEGEA